jgi:hypothetical protein
LPDPITSWNAPNARFLLHRMIFLGGFLLTGLLLGLLRQRGGIQGVKGWAESASNQFPSLIGSLTWVQLRSYFFSGR